MKIKLRALILLLGLGLAVPALKVGAASASKDQVFSALAQLPTAGATLNVRVQISGYSTANDAQALRGVLQDGGPEALLKTLQKMKSIGRIEREGTVGFYNLKFICSKATPDGGRMIYALADRPIGFLEAYFDTRSRDYPFGVMELQLKPNDKGKLKGEGSLVYAAKIKSLEGDRIEVENFSFAPIKLLGVREL